MKKNIHLSFVGMLFFAGLLLQGHATAKTLKVGVFQESPPFSFQRQDNAEPVGFCVDLANLLAANMALDADVYIMEDSDLINSLKNGAIDLIIGIADSSFSDLEVIEIDVSIHKKFFNNNRYSDIAANTGAPFRIIAVEKGGAVSLPAPSNTTFHFIEVENQEEALELVNSGDAHSYFSNNNVLTKFIIKQKGFSNIKEGSLSLETYPLALAVRKDNQELFNALGAAYGKTIENSLFYKKYGKWSGGRFRYYTGAYLKYIIPVVVLIVFTLLMSLLWNFTLKRKVQKVTKHLQISEQKYRDLIELSPDIIHLISRHGEIKLANQMALTLLGYNETELLSIRLQNIVQPDQTEIVASLIENVFTGKLTRRELTFRDRNGNKIQVEMAAIKVREPFLREELACCFSRDITERKRLEERLIHSDRLAVMGQMAAGIAHELNNPLGIILTNSEDMLYHDVSAEESSEILKTIERNAIRASQIIENLLSFTRPASLDKTFFNMAHIVDESLLFFKPNIKQKSIVIDKSFLNNPIVFWGDEKLIQQLIINLILNSIQAIKNSGVIKIRLNEADEGGERRIILEVEDNGKGIPKDEIHKIFAPFFTSRKKSGFGLGLFISKIIVDNHDGSIHAQSTEKKGTIMTASFPANKPPDKSSAYPSRM